MKLRLGIAICLMLAAGCASATSILYSNGAINGTVAAYSISLGSAVSDSFTLTAAAGSKQRR
jgi:hypothetical protein